MASAAACSQGAAWVIGSPSGVHSEAGRCDLRRPNLVRSDSLQRIAGLLVPEPAQRDGREGPVEEPNPSGLAARHADQAPFGVGGELRLFGLAEPAGEQPGGAGVGVIDAERVASEPAAGETADPAGAPADVVGVDRCEHRGRRIRTAPARHAIVTVWHRSTGRSVVSAASPPADRERERTRPSRAAASRSQLIAPTTRTTSGNSCDARTTVGPAV